MKNPESGHAHFPWRALLYGVILLYLIGDLYWLGGPLRETIDRRKPFTRYSRERAQTYGWVATVNTEPITREQLNRALDIYFYRRGKNRHTVSELDLRLARMAALRELIQDTLVRQHAIGEGFVPDRKLVEKHIQAFESQFASPEDLEERSRAQGMDAATRRKLLADQITGQLWLEDLLTPDESVIEKEARKWFDQNRESGTGFSNPELIRARHIFLSTVTEDTPERENLIRQIQRQLQEEEPGFEALAAEFSEDERSKLHGGDLNWFSAERMPRDFCDVAFGLRMGETSQPFRTSLGWHIVEILDRQPSRELSFEELKPEIMAHVESEFRRGNIAVYLEKLETASAIEWFPEVLNPELDR